VWQTLSQSWKLSVINLPVVFEDCKFIRAVTMSKSGFIKLFVTIQRGSGNFEVLYKDMVVVTGRVSHCSNVSQEQTNLKPFDLCSKDATQILEQDEIYKELNLRGYNYRQDWQCCLDFFIDPD
jgi:fatty acid synthase